MAAAARSLLPDLPISATANAITLVVERPDRGWQVHKQVSARQPLNARRIRGRARQSSTPRMTGFTTNTQCIRSRRGQRADLPMSARCK
jgi:hypothetical protein